MIFRFYEACSEIQAITENELDKLMCECVFDYINMVPLYTDHLPKATYRNGEPYIYPYVDLGYVDLYKSLTGDFLCCLEGFDMTIGNLHVKEYSRHSRLMSLFTGQKGIKHSSMAGKWSLCSEEQVFMFFALKAYRYKTVEQANAFLSDIAYLERLTKIDIILGAVQ
jgi:hypothetical protein